MSTNKDNREYDRDKELQKHDRDHVENRTDVDQDQLHLQTPEELQDKDHQMDKRRNDVELGDSYHRSLEKPNSDSNIDIERRWEDIKHDYRKRHPSVTDEDVTYRSGEFDNMTDRIAKRTNRTREDVYEEIIKWENSRNNS